MITDYFPLTGPMLLIICAVLQLSRLLPDYPFNKAVAIVLGILLSVIPFDGASLLLHVYAYFSSLSLTSVSLLTLYIYDQFTDNRCYGEDSFKWLMISTLIISILFYPMALGLTQFDPYTLGFSTIYMWFLTLIFSITALYFHHYLIVSIILSANIAFYFNLNGSLNHWDYLLDPLLSFYALYWVIKHYTLTYRNTSSHSL